MRRIIFLSVVILTAVFVYFLDNKPETQNIVPKSKEEKTSSIKTTCTCCPHHENDSSAKNPETPAKIYTCNVFGFIFDTYSRPIQNATVGLEEIRPVSETKAPIERYFFGSDINRFSTKSLQDGSFEVKLNTGRYTLYVHTGSHIAHKEIVQIDEGQSRYFVIQLQEAAKIEGVVLDTNSAPIADALIGSADMSSLLAKSDKHGRFVISGIEKDKTNIFIMKKGYATKHMKSVSAWSSLTVVLEQPCVVQGRVDGAQVYTVKLAIGDQVVNATNFRTNEFQVYEVSPGEYTVWAENEESISQKIKVLVYSGQYINLGLFFMEKKK